MEDSKMVIACGWEPIEYRSPEAIDGQYTFIQWNYPKGWLVTCHPTVDGYFPTALEALQAIAKATH